MTKYKRTEEFQVYKGGNPISPIVIGSPHDAVKRVQQDNAERAHLYVNYEGSRRFVGYAYPNGDIIDGRR